MNTNFITKASVAVLFTASFAGSLSAATLTENTLTDTSVYDFSEGPSSFTDGPETRNIGDLSFIFTSTHYGSVFDYDGLMGLNGNGYWTREREGFAGLNSMLDHSITFTFSQTVSGVGGFINYAETHHDGYDDPILRIFDVAGVELESFNLAVDAPISAPGQPNAGAFRGFDVGSDIIGSFSLSGSYIVIDDLTVSSNVAPVPLPASLPLMLLGLGGFGLFRRKKANS